MLFRSTCLFVIKADYVNKTSSLYKYVKKIGGDYDFSKMDRGTLTDFIKKEFKQNGKQAEQKAINRLIDMSGYFNRESEYGLYDFQNEIKKICVKLTGSPETPANATPRISDPF